MIKLIIFDLDGVLLESKEIHYEALNQALAEVDPNCVISMKDHLNRFDGLTTKKKLSILVNEGKLHADKVQQVSHSKQVKTADLLATLKEDKAKQEIFAELKQRGYKIAVASNAIKATVITSLDKLGLLSQPDIVLCNENVLRTKPASEIYLRACVNCGVDPCDTLILEDSAIGRQGALASGCHLMPIKDSLSWTKEDLFNCIESKNKRGKHMWDGGNLNVVIPMAGAGSRFEKAGYTFPKPLIEVRGKPMIQVVVENLGVKANYIFIVQKSHKEKYNLQQIKIVLKYGMN